MQRSPAPFALAEQVLVLDAVGGAPGFDRDRLSISGYWRRGLNDETWRAVKAAEAAYRLLPAAGRP